MHTTVHHAGRDKTSHKEVHHHMVHSGRTKVTVLCDQHRELMVQFSDLCVKRLNNHLLIKPFIPLFQHFFDANVLKEIEKDRLVIESVVAGFEKGRGKSDLDLEELFEMTKTVDAEFLKKSANPLFSIKIRYDDFAEIRKKRIAVHHSMLFELLCNWHDVTPFHGIVQNTFSEITYREIITEILHLYNRETKMLSNSIAFHGPAGKAKHLFAEKLFIIMGNAAGDVAAAYTRRMYSGSKSGHGTSGPHHTNG